MLFLLSNAQRCTQLAVPTDSFDNADAATAALRENTCGAIAGAISFEADAKDSLWGTSELLHGEPVAPTPPRLHPAAVKQLVPSPPEHLDLVRTTRELIHAGQASKVVLARSMDLLFDSPIDPAQIASALAAGNPQRNAFLVDLSASPAHDHILVGASPELLIEKSGPDIHCHPLAGSAPRSADWHTDRAARDALVSSMKNLREHQFVVSHIRDALTPLCTQLSIPEQPSVLATGEMWHLGTPIHGRLADRALTALDVARVLHPTPAVCGKPTAAARSIIETLEEPRGFYAGMVGWCDANGDGRWMVAIRCAEIFDDRRTVRTWAGGGIVADSDPQAELDETTAKFATVLRAMGCPEVS